MHIVFFLNEASEFLSKLYPIQRFQILLLESWIKTLWSKCILEILEKLCRMYEIFWALNFNFVIANKNIRFWSKLEKILTKLLSFIELKSPNVDQNLTIFFFKEKAFRNISLVSSKIKISIFNWCYI